MRYTAICSEYFVKQYVVLPYLLSFQTYVDLKGSTALDKFLVLVNTHLLYDAWELEMMDRWMDNIVFILDILVSSNAEATIIFEILIFMALVCKHNYYGLLPVAGCSMLVLRRGVSSIRKVTILKWMLLESVVWVVIEQLLSFYRQHYNEKKFILCKIILTSMCLGILEDKKC